MILKLLPLSLLLCAAAPVAAQPLTIRPGESWAFILQGGQPAKARRVAASAEPRRGEIKATLVSAMGTTMTLSNHSRTRYTFRAELIGAANARPRTCVLPPNRQPALEYWPTRAAAVRLSDFKPAPDGGNCP